MENLTKFIVNIEEKRVDSFEVMAKNIDEAMEIAGGKYNSGEFTIKADAIGTDAEFQVCNAEGEALTDWH